MRAELIEVLLSPQVHIRPVIQSRPTNGLVIYPKSQVTDEMQRDSVCGTQTGYVTCVRMDFRPVKHNVEDRFHAFDALSGCHLIIGVVQFRQREKHPGVK